jgi:hypothetical protein
MVSNDWFEGHKGMKNSFGNWMKGNHYYYNLEKQGKLKRLRQKPHCHMLISVIIKERPITRCNLQENIWLKFN